MTAEKKSGKQATKGQKQIVEENAKTLTFYRNMMIGGFVTTLICWGIIFSEIYTLDIVLTTLSVFLQFCCYRFMVYMARAKYTETGQLIDGGVDLNMESGISEHIKDTIILISAIQVLTSIFFRSIWLGLLLIPLRLFQLLWKNVLGPWFFQKNPTPEQEAQDDKKQRKLERRLKRNQH